MKYYFILGNNKELSQAEIETKLHQLKVIQVLQYQEDTFLIYETNKPLKCEALINQLGGTIKIGEILEEQDDINKINLKKYLPKQDNKLRFGISNYNIKLDVNRLGKKLKRELKDEEISARFVSSKEYPLSSVIVKKQKLLTNGIELCVFKSEEAFLLGKTLAVQPFEKFSQVDFGRPSRDTKIGMLPPKVAQIMINLAELQIDKSIYDPFCGSGTVLQQAALLGYTKLSGSDLSEKQVEASKTNLEWLRKEMELHTKFHVFQSDAQTVSGKMKFPVDSIVTEPHLGPPLKGSEQPQQMEIIISSLAKLYKNSLLEFNKILKPKSPILIIIPSFYIKSKTYEIDIKRIIPKNFKIEDSWQYFRTNQRVIRNIYKIRKR